MHEDRNIVSTWHFSSHYMWWLWWPAVPIPVQVLNIKTPHFVSCSGDSNRNGSKELYEPDLERDERPELQILQRPRVENLGLGNLNEYIYMQMNQSKWTHVFNLHIREYFNCNSNVISKFALNTHFSAFFLPKHQVFVNKYPSLSKIRLSNYNIYIFDEKIFLTER